MANTNLTRNWSLEAKVAYYSDPSPDGCLLWMGGTNTNGYAALWRRGRQRLVGRELWVHTRGPIATGLCVCHTCDVRVCVNINHLWLGTNQDNLADMVSKKRHARGIKQGHAKLTDGQVIEIYDSTDTQVSIAAKYHITQAAVSLIKLRKNWNWLLSDRRPQLF